MYIVWTKPSTAKKIKSSMITPGEAVMAGIVPTIAGAAVSAAPGMPLGGVIRTTVAAGSVLYLLKRITAGMSSLRQRASNSKGFAGETFYEHAKHSTKRAAESQAAGLRKAKYKVRISKG